MRTYYLISLILFVIMWFVVNIAKVIFGGNTIVPPAISLVLIIVMANTLTAITLFVINMFRGKI